MTFGSPVNDRTAPRHPMTASPSGFATFLRHRPEQATDAFGDVLADRIGEVLVPSGHGSRGPTHDAHRGPLRYAERQQDGRSRVPSIMQPRISEPSFPQDFLPLVVVGVRV